ncbi:Glutamate 5-kinase [Mycoemilia scoparia]|uniref:Glutamate 5-kinase n=1 Tax=Mycoemilia scoparia TaxID=417184 RepID=A0A9W8DK24_9FUNG|nr:Glutamate 5-kinase [Mycoemilia scoparia]
MSSISSYSSSSTIASVSNDNIVDTVSNHHLSTSQKKQVHFKSSTAPPCGGSETATKVNPSNHISSNKPTRTIVLKIGTSSICDAKTHLPLLGNLSRIVETIIQLKQKCGYRVVLVSSGAVGAGLQKLGLSSRPSEKSAIQACAAVGQGFLMSLWSDLFGQLGQPVAQVLITRNDLSQSAHYINASSTFQALLEMGVVPIVNENDAVSQGEIKFGDNDTLSAITAGIVHADYLFLLTDVDCLYTDNPSRNPNAKPIKVVKSISDLRRIVDVSSSGSSVGTGGMETKLIAAELATSAGVTTIITSSTNPEKIVDIVAQFSNPKDSNGGINDEMDHIEQEKLQQKTSNSQVLCTIFLPNEYPMIDRKWWILHGMRCAGTIYIDAGAVVALSKYKKSLFAAGIKKVVGEFTANQSVRVVYEVEKHDQIDLPLINNGGHHSGGSGLVYIRGRDSFNCEKQVIEVGHGLVNYTSAEINRIKGHYSSEFEDILGYCNFEDVIGRGNMVSTISDEDINDIFVTRVSQNKIRAEQRVPVSVVSY